MFDEVGSKLVTQNLLTSAALYETPYPADSASIQDLCVLINLFCLYDNVIVLGRQSNPHELRKNDSSIYEVLDDQDFVKTHGKTDDRTDEEISIAARSHLRSVLPPNADVDRYHKLMVNSLEPSSVNYGLNMRPDRGQDFSSIPQWLEREPSYEEFLANLENHHNVSRSYTFMARTFLYIGYADIHGLTFIPDTTRIPVVEQVYKKEEELCRKLRYDLPGDLLGTLHDSVGAPIDEQAFFDANKVWDVVTPLAAIVFNRAATKAHIARQMADLRYELRNVRMQLGKLEAAARGFATMHEEKAAQLKWGAIRDEIRSNFKDGESLISWRPLLNFCGAASKAIFKPLSGESWVGALAALSDVPEAFGPLMNRWPIIEIHRLEREMPGTSALRSDVKRLFGITI